MFHIKVDLSWLKPYTRVIVEFKLDHFPSKKEIYDRLEPESQQRLKEIFWLMPFRWEDRKAPWLLMDIPIRDNYASSIYISYAEQTTKLQ